MNIDLSKINPYQTKRKNQDYGNLTCFVRKKVCKSCQSPFETTAGTAKYCEKCRKDADQKRKRRNDIQRKMYRRAKMQVHGKGFGSKGGERRRKQ